MICACICFRRTTRGGVYAEPGKKPTPCANPRITSDLERVGGACGDIRGPRLGRRAHGEGSDRSRRRRGRKPGWGASLGGRCGRLCGRLVPSLFGRGRRDAPPRSGETGGKGCRPTGRRGRHARGRPGMGSRRRREGHSPRPSSGEQAARRRRKRERQRERHRWRATQSGRMQTCEQTGRWERTGQVMGRRAPRTPSASLVASGVQ